VSYTVNCVRCLRKRASIWGGHVTDHRDKVVLAGWCANHLRIAEANGPWYGHWKRAMGRSRKIGGKR